MSDTFSTTGSAPNAPVAVLGAGSWGTALALLLSEGVGRSVRLWDRSPRQIEALRADGENKRYLPGIPLLSNVTPTATLQGALADADCVIVAVPSGAIEAVLQEARSFLRAGTDIVLAAKGLEADTGRLPFEVAQEALEGTPTDFPLIALSGPNLASEVAQGIPAAAVAACPEHDAAVRTANRFRKPTFRVYTGTDRTGVELGGAVKNVLAIAGGVSDGLGFGDNTKAALLTRGLAEMTRLGVACGARADTFYGLAGVGDLMATAASRLSRNWRVGEGLAKGEALDQVLTRLGQVAEGVPTCRGVLLLAARREVEMPVCAAVHDLLFTPGASPRALVERLLSRTRREEGEVP